MPITPRNITIIPSIIIETAGGAHTVPNLNRKAYVGPLVFAYRKTAGLDKRVRILTYAKNFMGYPSVSMYVIDSETKGSSPILAPTSLNVLENLGRSQSLTDWWVEEYEKGNTAFDEGLTYTLNRYSFEILGTKELDNLSQSILEYNWEASIDAKNFKY